MDYDPRQTGGNGFIIEFPDSMNLPPITRALRRDNQGIHRLETISILESIEELLQFGKKHPEALRKGTGVTIYTDRIRVTDDELINPYRVRDYRKRRWYTHEGKPVKDSDLLDRIDKGRKKLARDIRSRVEIPYSPEKKTRSADTLSKLGKRIGTRSTKVIKNKLMKN